MVPVLVKRNTADHPWTYQKLDHLQREVSSRVREGEIGALIFSEVAPVVTVGRRTKSTDFLFDEKTFSQKGIELSPVDRGGLATYHGPGQWVVFAVDRLERLVGDSCGVKKAVYGLLEAACETCEKFQMRATIRHGNELGVWTAAGKIASVGVHIQDRVLLHGLALNVFPTKESFYGIRPCGLDAQPAYLYQDSLYTVGEASGETHFLAVKSALERAVLTRFWKEVL